MEPHLTFARVLPACYDAYADMYSTSPNKLAAIGDEDPGKEEVIIVNKPGVKELTVVTTSDNQHDPAQIDAALASTPVLNALYTRIDDLMLALNEAAPFLQLSSLYHLKVARLAPMDAGDELGPNTTHRQQNCRKPPAFAAHFDTQPGTGRTLSLCLWLNEHWTEEHGGHLRVFPAPLAHVDVEPVSDRVAIFCSHHMLHRVRPLQYVQGKVAPRYCVSMMFRGSPVPFPSTLPTMLADKLREIDSDVLAMLQLARRQQRDLVMLVFREESVNSMREAFDHGDTEDETKKLERAVKHFENRLQAARQKVSPAILQLIDDFLPLNPADLD